MNPQWFVITGKTPALSRAELEAQIPHLLQTNASPTSVTEDALVFKGELPSERVLNRFGGITRAGRIIEAVELRSLSHQILAVLESVETNRIDFGISAFNILNAKEVERLALDIKRKLKLKGKPVRAFIANNDSVLSKVVVNKQLLAKGGREFILLPNNGSALLCETMWVHPFEEWAEREFGKIHADKQRGLLPQKLARIMVNLTGLPLQSTTTIFDPSCGVGVALMEASMLGCAILGSDIDEKAVRQTKDNLHFAKDDERIWLADSRNVRIPKVELLGIVTEPYLGPFWGDQISRREVERVINELSVLYEATLINIRKQVSVGTPIVMVFPVIADQPLWKMFVDRIGKLRYSTLAGPLRYERVDQVVKRDIVRLEAN